MYALPKGNTNKLLVKTRRGITQKLDCVDNSGQREQTSKKDVTSLPEMSSPKPVFHMNGKRSHHHKTPAEIITPQHEEMIRYIDSTWKCVKKEYEMTETTAKVPTSTTDLNATTQFAAAAKVPKICYYNNKSSTSLPNFEPFDLETFWGQRLFANITQSTG